MVPLTADQHPNLGLGGRVLMSVCVPCVSLVPVEVRSACYVPLELELWVVMNHHVDPGAELRSLQE